ncbi:MAG TPA: SgcJ/EcaC family oxidoreductase [Candidatus Acidoferrales bacterium]|jgi:uncharacterized protein (TIGR02246 family)
MLHSSRLPVLVVALFALSFASGCFQSGQKDAAAERQKETQQSLAADEAAIRANSVAWSQASQAKDVEKAVSFYADDALEFVNHGQLLKGKDEIRKEWTTLLGQPGPGLSFATTGLEVASSGDLAYEYGTYELVTLDKKKKATDEKGKYVVIWKKQADGNWKAAVDIDNTDQ